MLMMMIKMMKTTMSMDGCGCLMVWAYLKLLTEILEIRKIQKPESQVSYRRDKLGETEKCN
jgi:hypothetical protein